MRPRGEIREVMASGLSAGAGNTRQLALRTGVGVSAARMTLDNMVRAGQVAVVREERVPGVRRPVPVYGLVGSAKAERADHHDWALITCWRQWPATA